MLYLQILGTTSLEYQFRGQGTRGFVNVREFNSVYHMNPMDLVLRLRSLSAKSTLQRLGIKVTKASVRSYQCALQARNSLRIPACISSLSLASLMRRSCNWLRELAEKYPTLHQLVYTLAYDYDKWLNAWDWAMDSVEVCRDPETGVDTESWYAYLMKTWEDQVSGAAEAPSAEAVAQPEAEHAPVQQELPLCLEGAVADAVAGPAPEEEPVEVEDSPCQRISSDLAWLNEQHLSLSPALVDGHISFKLEYALTFKADPDDLANAVAFLNLSRHPLVETARVADSSVSLMFRGDRKYPGSLVDSYVTGEVQPAVDQIVKDITELLNTMAEIRERYARIALVEP